MARDKLTEYSATASENTVCGDVNIAENSALPSDMNNFAREVMSHLKAFSDGTDAIDALTVTGAATIGNGLTVDDDGATVLTVDRATSGGTIIDVQKDGSSVGTIAEKDGEITIGSGDVGLRFYAAGDAVIPVTSTNQEVRDNAIDLGGSSFRFNDAYLGGSLYIGGTASANALNDYEEGTFTPSLNPTGGGSISISSSTAKYTKIGNLVFINVFITVGSTSSPTGRLGLSGSPFSATGQPYAAVCHVNGFSSFSGKAGALVEASGTFNIDRYVNGGIAADLANNVGAGDNIFLTATYPVS